jgi:DNA-directed RNA polymerase specialized sigma24 family protein
MRRPEDSGPGSRRRDATTGHSATRRRLKRSLELRGASNGTVPSPRAPTTTGFDATTAALAVGSEAARRYEAALVRLRSRDREALLGRLELQWSYRELADAFGVATPDEARSLVTRALGRLVEAMRE